MSISADSGLERRTFRLVHPDEPERVVRGCLVLPRGARNVPGVMLLHGFKGFMDWGFFPLLAEEIAGRGLAAISFNFSGSGIGEDLENFTEDEAFAKDTLTRQLEDTERVRAWIDAERPGVDADRMGLFGHSRGGGIALLHAARRGDYRAIVTWSAIPDADRFDEETVGLWRRQGYIMIPNARLKRDHRLDTDLLFDIERNREQLDVEAACARLRAPALLIHGELDDVVEPAALERLGAAFAPGVAHELLVAGAGHTLGAVHPLGEVPDTLRSAIDATLEHFVRSLRAG